MSVFEKMTAIADLIRSPLKTDEKMGLDRMAELLPEALDVKYNDGYSAGHTDGYDSGEADGLVQGEKIGYENGKNERNAVMHSILDRSVTEVKAEDLKGLIKIGRNAFRGCHEMTSIEIPEGVYTLQIGALQECQKLSSVKLPKSLEVIDQNAISALPMVNELTLYQNVRIISKGALCPGSTENKATIRLLKTTPPTLSSGGVDASMLKEFIVPIGAGEAFKSATNWSAIADYIVEMFYMGSSDVTFGEGISTVEMDVEMTSVGRYLVIDAKCDLDLSDEDNSVASLDGFTMGSYVEIGSTISAGRNVIDLYGKFTEEEVRAWKGSTLPIQFDFATYDDLEDKTPYNCRISFYLSEVEPE